MSKKLSFEQNGRLRELLQKHVIEDRDNPGFAKILNDYTTRKIADEVPCTTDSVTYRIRQEMGLRIKKKVEPKLVSNIEELPLMRVPNENWPSDLTDIRDMLVKALDKIEENNKLFTGIARYHRIKILTEDPTLRHLFPDLWPAS